MKNNAILIAIVALVIGGGAGFIGGMKYQESKSPNFTTGQFFGNGGQIREGQRQGGNSFRPVAGEIISSDNESLTVKLADGSSKIVILSDKTTINKAEKGQKSDLKDGVNIAVFGPYI